MQASKHIDPAILEQAADWLVQLHSGEATAEEQVAAQRWRAQSQQHEQAWLRAQQFIGAMQQLPPAVSQATLRYASSPARRRAIKQLAVLLAASPGLWLAWKTRPWLPYTSDLHTETGEQRHLTLADGTALIVNTASSVNISYSAQQRLLTLEQGEIHITTAHDAMRPFRVQTRDGAARALGTRFSVRLLEGGSHVAVFDGAVELTPLAMPAHRLILQAGQQGEFDATQTSSPLSVNQAQESWTRGFLIAHHMRLQTLLAELDRYRPGLLRCHPDVAELRVSGAFPLMDTERSLDLLQSTMPIAVTRISRYWVTVGPPS